MVDVLRHIGQAFLSEREIGMMCEQMKELDEDHLEVVHLDTWGGAVLSTVNSDLFEKKKNLEVRHDMRERRMLSPGDN